MADNKVRLRNLDEEVLKYLHATSGTIGFDQLSPDVVTAIKNNTSTSGSSYNDSELRNRIVTIENTMVSKISADSLYATKKDYDTSTTVDSKIEKAKTGLETDISNITKNFISKTPDSITEDLLSYELRAKINSSNGSGGSSGTNNNLDELKNSVSKNTSAIAEINNTLSKNVYLKSSPISIDDLDSNTQTLIHNARQNTVLITENDLDETLKNKVNQKEAHDAEAQSVINSMYNGSQTGQVLIAKKIDTSGQNTYSVVPKYIFATDIFLFQLDSKYLDQQIVIKDTSDDSDSVTFDSGKTYAQNHNCDYIADLKRNILLQYDRSKGTWSENNSAQDLFNKLIGTFFLSYPDNSIYFCNGLGQESIIKIISPNDYIDEDDLNIISTKISDVEKTINNLASAVIYKGSVDAFTNLPTTNKIGDMYNIKNSGGTDGNGTAINAGDNVVWTGTAWDNVGGTFNVEETSDTEIDNLFTTT